MLASLVLAVAVTTHPPGPLSPADLPPPPAAKPVEATPPAPPTGISFCVKVDVVTGPVEDVPAKAVAAIAAAPGFRFADVGPDGAARGYTDTCLVVVTVVPDALGTSAYVVAAGFDADRPAVHRAAAAVLDRLIKSPAAREAATRAGTPDPAADARLSALAVHVGLRPHTPHARHVGPLVEFALARRGYGNARAGEAGGAVMAVGTRDDRSAVTIVAEPNRSKLTTHVLTAAAGPDPARVAAEAKAAGELLVKLLYD